MEPFFSPLSHSFLPSFSPPPPSFFLFFFSYFLFLLIHLHFLLLFVLLLLSFSFSFSSFPFSFSLLFFLTLLPILIKVGETFPHFPPFPHVTFTFFLYFHDFSFPIISSFDTWLNVTHSHKCTTWLIPCVTLLWFHVASTCSCHVSPDTRCLEKQ